MDLDDVPVAVPSVNGGIPNDPNAAPDEQNFDELPFAQLISDSNWKAHKAAYDRIVNGGSDVDTDAFSAHLSRLVKDINGPAADSFVEALATALEGDAIEAAHASSVALALTVDKALTGRPRAATAAIRVLHSLTCARQNDAVFDALVKAMGAKAPKLRHAAVGALGSIVDALGIQHFNVKTLVKAVVPLFNDTDAKVRREAMVAAVHCYRYIGNAIQPFLADVREVQRNELERMFQDAQPATASSSAGGGKGGAAARPSCAPKARGSDSRSQSPPDYAGGGGDDGNYNDLPESSVVGRLAPDFLTFSRDKAEQWKPRTQRIESELLPLLSAGRITASADYMDIFKAIRDYLNDPQLPISNAGFKCAQAVARSLRVGVAPYARFIVPALFDKFKEKKSNVLEATSTTLDLMLRHGCVQPDQLHDDFEAACGNKLPNHRQALLNWATHAVATSPDPAAFSRLSAAGKLLGRLVNDDKVEVREAAMQLAATIVASVGPGGLAAFVAKLDDKQHLRVMGAPRGSDGSGGPAHLDVAAVGAVPARVRSAPSSTLAGSRSTAGALGRVNSASTLKAVGSTSGATGGLARRQSLVGTTSAAAASGAAPVAKPSGAAVILDEELFAATAVSPADARRALVEYLCPIDPAVADAVEQLGAREWRARADAATLIANAAMQMPSEGAGVCAAALLCLLRRATDWKEAMFQVVNANAQALLTFVHAADSLAPWAVFVVVQGFVARLTEPKSRAIVADLFTAVTEQVGPKLVVRLITAVAAEAKNAKLTTEVLEWTELALLQFSTAPIDARSLIEFVRAHVFEQPNPAVKAAGVRVCVALRRRLGARFDAMLGDINAHIRKSYEMELAKDEDNAVPEVPQRRVRNPTELPGSGPTASVARGGGAAAAPAAASIEGDLPPVDISARLAIAVKQLGDTNDWKLRAAGLRTIEDAVTAAARTIAPAGVSDAFRALKGRLDEPNKNLVLDSLRAMSLLADAVVPATGARAGLRAVFGSTVLMMGDQKTALRDEAVRVSNKAVEVVGLEPLSGTIVKAMATDNQAARVALADMILAGFRAGHHAAFPPRGMTPLVQPLLKMFVDRNTNVRATAEACFSYVMSNVGFDVIARAVTSFKPADQNVIGPVLDRIRPVDEPPVAPEPARLERTAGLPPGPSAHYGAAPGAQQQQHDYHHRGAYHGDGGGGDDVMDAPVASRHNAQFHADPMASGGAMRGSDAHHHHEAAAPAMPPRARAGISVADVAAGLRAAHTRAIPQLCADLKSIMDLDVLAVDARTLDAVIARLQDVFADELAGDNHVAADVLLQTLCALVGDERFAMNLDAGALERLLLALFHCITSPHAPAAPGPLRAVNQCVDFIVRGAGPEAVITAVFALAMDLQQSDLITANELTAKLADLPFRVLIRFAKFDRLTSPDAMLRATHSFLSVFPPSRLQARTDRPIRVVKQILNDARARFGGERCLTTCEALVGRTNLVFGYLQMMEQQQIQQQKAAQEEGGARSPAAAAAGNGLERTNAIPRHSMAAGAPRATSGSAARVPLASGAYTDALSNMKPNVAAPRVPESSPVSLIFAKARKSETSQSALHELYCYMREHPKCPEVEKQLARCSDAFKTYIRNNLDKFAAEERASPVC